jgi:hypothetical protein
MNFEILAPLLITIGVAIAGWHVTHRLSMNRDRANNRRELRVQYLIEVYRKLESVSNRPFSDTTVANLEAALADIQLFGTVTQVRLAQQFVEAYSAGDKKAIRPLLLELRDDLRRELDVEPVPYKPMAFRIEFEEEPSARSVGDDA